MSKTLDEPLIGKSGSQRARRAQSVVYQQAHPDAEASTKGRPVRRWSMADVGEVDKRVSIHDADLCVNSGLVRMMTTGDMDHISPGIGKLHRRASAFVGMVVGEHDDADASDASDGEGRQSNGEATVNLLNNCLGSGLLAISFAISEAGVFFALFLIVFAVLLNKYTLLLNLKTCYLGHCDPSTTAVAEVACGKAGRATMVFMYTAFGFFCMVSYVSASADCITGLLNIFIAKDKLPSKVHVMICVWVCALFPPTLIRSLKGVAVLSFVAFSGGVIMVVSLICCCGQIIWTNGLDMDSIQWWPASTANLVTATPLLCLAFAVQAGGGVVLATMKDTSQENINKVANGSFTIVFLMDFILGFGAYLTFTAATKGDVIENLPEGNPVSALARLCLLDLVVLSYMIMCIPCKIAIIDFFFGKNEALNEASGTQFYATTMVLNVLALCVAVAVPDLSLINGINGSICTNFNAFIMPATFNILLRANPVDKDVPAVPIKSKENIPLFLIAAFGFGMLLLGTSQLAKQF